MLIKIAWSRRNSAVSYDKDSFGETTKCHPSDEEKIYAARVGSMRQRFRQYFPSTKDEVAAAWDAALFTFDANVLLNIYRYSEATSRNLVDFIEVKSSRIRITHQFGLEYARNRAATIAEQSEKYKLSAKAIREYVDNKRQHPHLSSESSSKMEEILQELDKKRADMDHMIRDDHYAEVILKSFSGKLGACPTEVELAQLHSIAKERYDKDIPPGFADLKDKGMPAAAGDYIGWHQIIEIAKADKKDIIFVSGDRKNDWWITIHGRSVGPRPELIEEFTRLSQQNIHFYDFEGFLRAIKDLGIAEVSDQAIEEVREGLLQKNETPQKEREAQSALNDPKAALPPESYDEKSYSDASPSKAGSEDLPKMSESGPEEKTLS
jgi:PIN like domain